MCTPFSQTITSHSAAERCSTKSKRGAAERVAQMNIGLSQHLSSISSSLTLLYLPQGTLLPTSLWEKGLGSDMISWGKGRLFLNLSERLSGFGGSLEPWEDDDDRAVVGIPEVWK